MSTSSSSSATATTRAGLEVEHAKRADAYQSCLLGTNNGIIAGTVFGFALMLAGWRATNITQKRIFLYSFPFFSLAGALGDYTYAYKHNCVQLRRDFEQAETALTKFISEGYKPPSK